MHRARVRRVRRESRYEVARTAHFHEYFLTAARGKTRLPAGLANELTRNPMPCARPVARADSARPKEPDSNGSTPTLRTSSMRGTDESTCGETPPTNSTPPGKLAIETTPRLQTRSLPSSSCSCGFVERGRGA